MDDAHAFFDLLQWPGMVFGVAGAWLVGGRTAGARLAGFTCFLISNLFLITWAGAEQKWAIVVMQALFTVTSLRGMITNRQLRMDSAGG